MRSMLICYQLPVVFKDKHGFTRSVIGRFCVMGRLYVYILLYLLTLFLGSDVCCTCCVVAGRKLCCGPDLYVYNVNFTCCLMWIGCICVPVVISRICVYLLRYGSDIFERQRREFVFLEEVVKILL